MPNYQVTGLDPSPFLPLYSLDEASLQALGVRRMQVDRANAFPDRIELRDGEVGETMLLVNHQHLDVPTAYRSSHAIFVREGAVHAARVENQLPTALSRRQLSLRAFDAEGWMVDAALTAPGEAEAELRRLLVHSATAYVHAHYAARGCFAARIERC
jgi:hypothetical protein